MKERLYLFQIMQKDISQKFMLSRQYFPSKTKGNCGSNNLSVFKSS